MKRKTSRKLISLPTLIAVCSLLCCACGSGSRLDVSAGPFSYRRISTAIDSDPASGTLSLKQENAGDGLLLSLMVEDAQDLRSLAVEICFDAEAWQLADAAASELLGSEPLLLQSSMLVSNGTLAHGQVLIDAGQQAGFTGSGCLARFHFTPGAGDVPRETSAVSNALPLPQWDEGTWELNWPYSNTGDYDQNSEVNIADLTPIGIHFGEVVSDPLSSQAIIDGDANGEINIADITPIGVNYGRSLSAYRLWELASPLDWLGPADTVPLADIVFASATGLPAQDLLQFTYKYAADPGYRWLRLAPVSGEDTGPVTDYIFTYPSLQPLLSVADGTGLTGNGSEADPFSLEVPASVPLKLLLQDDTDVTADALSSFAVSGPAGGSISGSSLELDASSAGDYLVTATYDGVPSDPFALYFHVNEPPEAILVANPTSGNVPFTVELDASQSSDPDGEIVLAEWDFDNDGTFDRETGDLLTTLRRYDTEGTYEAVVRLTDDKGASSVSDPLLITVEPPNQPPQPVVSGNPLSGNTPLTVEFDASASSDPDGSIESISWDFDNDGSYELLDSQDFTPQHTFVVPGQYEVAVRLRDDDGAVAFSSPLFINVGGNFPPTAVLRAVPNAGPSPLLVQLDASESTDGDGSIVLVEWDFSGDGEYDQSGTLFVVSNLYTGDGVFHPVVRLTDNNGGVTVSEPATVTVGVAAGSPPVALLSALPQSGPAPLDVTFSGTGSTDADNDILYVEFDFENDGTWDVLDDDDFTVSHRYELDGTYEAVLRVTDSYGFRDTSDPVEITVSSGSPPTAFFQAASLSGVSPFDLVLDASGSSDPDGSISLYEWDVDADGSYDLATTSSSAQLSLVTEGQRDLRLRVTDSDGMSATFSREFTVSPPSLGWNDWSTGIVNPQNAHLRAVGGRPAVAWQSSGADLFFKRSADVDGHSWPVTGSLVDSDLTGYPGGSIRLVDFAVSGGVPLMLTLKGTAAQADHDMFVSRGLNSDGSSFALPLKIVSGPVFRPDRDNRGLPLLAEFSGLPGVCYGSDQSGGWHHIRALDSTGSSWQASPSAISGSQSAASPFGSLLQDPSGGALLFYFDQDGIMANRDPDGNGSNWNFREQLFSIGDVVRIQSITSSDSVLLLYTVKEGVTDYTLWASHASSPSFASWTDPARVIDINSSVADAQLLLDNGKPVVLLSGNPGGDGGVHYLRSHDARGSGWSETRRISSQTAGELRAATIVNGRLAAIHLRSNGALRLLQRE
ncbi:MAG: PKD domain-containing protein [Planctomycetales bacterium]|nr:PKD domain-containing protein [bacterium]UNM09402.1 MAG: PKD domain-containing protein [Planctomycetales bacterium]